MLPTNLFEETEFNQSFNDRTTARTNMWLRDFEQFFKNHAAVLSEGYKTEGIL